MASTRLRDETTPQIAPPLPLPTRRPPLLTAPQAIAAAHALAREFAAGAAERDRDRRLPIAEVERFSETGLWAISVPRAHGGAELPVAVMTEIVRIISAADPSLGQLPQNHFAFLHLLRAEPDEARRQFLFDRVLDGCRFGNALAELGTKTVSDWRTTIRPADPDGDTFIVDGVKSYCTGALFAHFVPVVLRSPTGTVLRAVIDRDAPGLTVIDDWSSFGQRTTASGTVRLDNVRVSRSRILGIDGWPTLPGVYGPVAQILQAAIDAGIAEAAIDDTVTFVRTRSRPWIDAGQQHAWEDPHTIARIGSLTIKLHAAEAMLTRSANIIDDALAAEPDPDTMADTLARASIAVAEAKVLTTEIAIDATNTLFELAGTASTLIALNLDRHWRNARTHTLHDPVRWKYHAVGDWRLNGTRPPVHPWI